jgi:hypothetical protein
MKSFRQFAKLDETLERRKSEDENAFIDKHVVDKKDLPDDYKVPKPEKEAKKDKSRSADYKEGEDKEVHEQVEEVSEGVQAVTYRVV